MSGYNPNAGLYGGGLPTMGYTPGYPQTTIPSYNPYLVGRLEVTNIRERDLPYISI